MIVVGLGAECNKSVIILNYQLSFINYQYIMKKILPDLIAILAFIILSFAYFFPADIEGRILFQHDSVAGVGAGQESKEYLERTGERTRWTNSIFGGMPTYQMSPSYDSTKTLKWVEKVYQLYLPGYVVLTFIMMLGFYILLRAFGLSAWLAGLGGMGLLLLFLYSDIGRAYLEICYIGLYSAYDCRCRIGLSEEIFVRRGYYSLVYCSSDSVESHSDELLLHVCDPVLYNSLFC